MRALRAREAVDAIQMGQMIGALNGMVDTLSNLERIRTSPVPLAYSIHLRQTVLLYLYALPFQLVDPVKAMGWSSIIVVAIASFTLLGIEAIGAEIEQPFGYDYNDLRLDLFCQGICVFFNPKDIRDELQQITERTTRYDSSLWGAPVFLCKEINGGEDSIKKENWQIFNKS